MGVRVKGLGGVIFYQREAGNGACGQLFDDGNF